MLQLYAQVGLSAILGHKRSFRRDALRAVQSLPLRFEIRGKEHIPKTGPRLLTINHYCHPKVRTWWIILSIAAQIPVEMSWVMASNWRYPLHMRWLTRWFFPRLARSYGFIAMPPMPPVAEETQARAKAVRQVLSLARDHSEIFLGLAPEGGDQPNGALISLPLGVGRFILMLMPYYRDITPLGIFFEGQTLVFNYGEAYALHAPDGLSPEERNHWAGEIVMRKIAQLLPENLRGAYRSTDPL